jgi:beta-glucosidase
VEPGRIVLTVAQSAADPGVAIDVDLTGEVRIVDHTRVQSSTNRLSATIAAAG